MKNEALMATAAERVLKGELDRWAMAAELCKESMARCLKAAANALTTLKSVGKDGVAESVLCLPLSQQTAYDTARSVMVEVWRETAEKEQRKAMARLRRARKLEA